MYPLSATVNFTLYRTTHFKNKSILKAFADDILNVVQMMICATDWVENIVGKGEKAGYQHFLLFPKCFLKASFPGSLKIGIVW